jgi:hypothetical protein
MLVTAGGDGAGWVLVAPETLAGDVVDDVLFDLPPNSDVDPHPAASGTVTARTAASLRGDIPQDGRRSGSAR